MKKLLAILALVLFAPLASACDVQRIVLRSYAPLAIETGCDCYGGAAIYSNRVLFSRSYAAPVLAVRNVVAVQRVQRVQVQRVSVRTVRTVERIRVR